MITQLREPVRRHSAWGKEIEPEYTVRPVQPKSERSAVGIRLSGLSKQFGDVTVLRDLDLEVPAGQFLAIIGKSGCGAGRPRHRARRGSHRFRRDHDQPRPRERGAADLAALEGRLLKTIFGQAA